MILNLNHDFPLFSRALLLLAVLFSFTVGSVNGQVGGNSAVFYATISYSGIIDPSFTGTLTTDYQYLLPDNPDLGGVLISDPTFTNNVWYSNSASFRKGSKNKAVSASEIAKKKGMNKFNPFSGSDNTHIQMDNLLLSGKAGDGGSPQVCKDAKSCGAAGDWMVKAGDPDKGGGYAICLSGSKNTCLSYKPQDGVQFCSTTDAQACSQWVLVPSKVGNEGEIKGYNIRPMSHPDHVLAVDPRTNQVSVEKWTPNRKASEALEPGKALKTDWSFTSQKGNQKPNQEKKPIQAAEQK